MALLSVQSINEVLVNHGRSQDDCINFHYFMYMYPQEWVILKQQVLIFQQLQQYFF